MTATLHPSPAPVVPAVLAHSRVEDVLGILTGTFVASLGLFLLQTGGVVTGGTAGLSLLLTHAVSWPFAAVFPLANLPFVLLAVTRKGWAFTVRSAVAVALLTGFSAVNPHLASLEHIDRGYAAVAGNLLAGVGMLILFRHGSSLGGFNVVALVAQDRLGWRAGYVQLCLDGLVVLAFAFVGDPVVALVSALGAVVLNLTLAMNHRPGRYVGR